MDKWSSDIYGGEELYGVELVLDLYNCDVSKFNRRSIGKYFTALCKLLKMKKCKRVFWDDVGVPIKERQTSPHTKGTTAIQFIITSNITIHCLDILEQAYVNIFSCKPFDLGKAQQFTQEWFNADSVRPWPLRRGINYAAIRSRRESAEKMGYK